MIYEIDSSAVDKYAEKLATLHKSALPTAIRNTLNKAAFNVKQGTLADSAKKNFINRDKNFFKANSTVKMATGWDIAKMQSEVGMYEDRLCNKSTNYAVKDLEQQEHGGVITNKTFIASKAARTGNSTNKMVRRQLSVDNVADAAIKVNRIHTRTSKNGKKVKVKNSREQFVVAVHKAGKGGFVMTDNAIIRVNSLNKTRNGSFKLSLLYSKKKGRSVKVKATHFMEEAAMKAAKGMPKAFERAAEFQIKKHLG